MNTQNIIGILSPNGEFIELKNKEEQTIDLKSKNEPELKEAYKFLTQIHDDFNTTELLANNGWCFFQQTFAGIPSTKKETPRLTDKQIDWIKENYNNLNKKQKYFLSEKLKFDKDERVPEEYKNVPFPGINI